MVEKLDLGVILKINEQIWKMAHESPYIEYGGRDTYGIKEDKLRDLIDNTPNEGLIDVATYYLKNLILLQAFSDANHRTACESVRYFFHKNNVSFKWSPDFIEQFQLEVYRLRFEIYGTYEELSISVLKEPKNELYNYCKACIEKTIDEIELTESN